VPLVKTAHPFVSKARVCGLAAVSAAAIFTVFALVGVGGVTGPGSAWLGHGDSIVEARLGSPAKAAAPAERLARPARGASRSVGAPSSRPVAKGSRRDRTQPARPPVPGAAAPVADHPVPQGGTPQSDPSAPAAPAAPALTIPVPQPPTAPPVLELPPPLPSVVVPALPPLPEVPQVPLPTPLPVPLP
jgi:hypothetical protein